MIDIYIKNIINPLEEYKKELLVRISNKRILYKTNKRKYKKLLKEIENKLYESYKKLDFMIYENDC